MVGFLAFFYSDQELHATNPQKPVVEALHVEIGQWKTVAAAYQEGQFVLSDSAKATQLQRNRNNNRRWL